MGLFRRNKESSEQPSQGEFSGAAAYRDLQPEPQTEVAADPEKEQRQQEAQAMRTAILRAPNPATEVRSRLSRQPDKSVSDVIAELNAEWQTNGVTVFRSSSSSRGVEDCHQCGERCLDTHYGLTKLPAGSFRLSESPRPDLEVSLGAPAGGMILAASYGLELTSPEVAQQIQKMAVSEVELHGIAEHPDPQAAQKLAQLQELLGPQP
jgi:hypothetical protein